MTTTGTDRPMDQPMTRDDMAAWFRARGMRDEAWLAEMLDEHAGKTEDEMDRFYESLHGSMA